MRNSTPTRCLLALLLTTCALAGCAEYDPPPEVKLRQPEGGAFTVGQAIELDFSEAIEPESLRVRIWPADARDIEGEFPDDAEPLVQGCTGDDGDCGDLTLSLDDARTLATLELAPETLGRQGVPMILEVERGLSDELGNDTGAPQRWAIQFRGDGTSNGEPVEFDDGVYIIVGIIEEPLPTVLTLIADVQVADDGTMALAGAEGDELGDAPKETRDPESLEVDTTELGWTAHTQGHVTVDAEGRRFLESDPFTMTIPIGGALGVELNGARLIAEVTENEEGNDRLEGTLSAESFVLINGTKRVEYEGMSTDLLADWVPPELAPAGHPTVCDDPCGVAGGPCTPPEDFPPAPLCEAAE